MLLKLKKSNAIMKSGKFREIMFVLLPAFVSSSSGIIRAPKAPTANNVNPMNHFIFTQFPEILEYIKK